MTASSPQRKRPTLWTEGETEALRSGVLKYGVGKWRDILQDSKLGPRLAVRNNMHLKDRWRVMMKTRSPGEEAQDDDVEIEKKPAQRKCLAHHPSSLFNTRNNLLCRLTITLHASSAVLTYPDAPLHHHLPTDLPTYNVYAKS